MKLLLFDIDGTLLDAGGAGLGALGNGLLDAFDLHPRVEEIPPLDLAGTTDSIVVRTFFGAFDIPDTPENRRRFFEHYAGHLENSFRETLDELRALAGVAELLEHLARESNHVLALLTGNAEAGARVKLRHYGLEGYFAFGAYGDEREHRNDLGPLALERAFEETGKRFQPSEVFIVGDTPRDIECARSAGFHSIAVATGRFGMNDLAGHQPDFLLNDLANLSGFLEALDGRQSRIP